VLCRCRHNPARVARRLAGNARPVKEGATMLDGFLGLTEGHGPPTLAEQANGGPTRWGATPAAIKRPFSTCSTCFSMG
jgi:hypothetical protein